MAQFAADVTAQVTSFSVIVTSHLTRTPSSADVRCSRPAVWRGTGGRSSASHHVTATITRPSPARRSRKLCRGARAALCSQPEPRTDLLSIQACPPIRRTHRRICRTGLIVFSRSVCKFDIVRRLTGTNAINDSRKTYRHRS